MYYNLIKLNGLVRKMTSATDKKTKSSKPLVKKTPALLAAIALLMGGATVYTLRQYGSVSQPETVPEAVVPQIKTVTALGRIEPAGEIIEVSVSSGAAGNLIQELLVKEGDKVRQGDNIAILDSRDRALATLQEAEASVAIAQANLAKIQAGAQTGEIQAQQAAISRIEAERSNNIAAQKATVARIEAELRNAQQEYQRYQQLYQQGAVTASQRDSKQLTLATAQEQLAEAKANLTRIETAQQQQLAEARATLNKIAEVRPVDVNIATAELKQAQSQVAIAQADLERSYIKSPQAGTVLKVLTRPGEIVASDTGVVRIGQINQMYAVAEVYESDVPKVRVGQTATITSSAISEPLTGTVEQVGLEIQRQEVVNTDPTANIDAKVVEVRVKLDEASSQRVSGLTNLLVNVQIEI